MQHGTRTERVIEAIRRKITNRALEAGEKLPSIRAFAKTMQVSASTVVDAYDRLAADGLIYARRGAGFFVADIMQPLRLSNLGSILCGYLVSHWTPART
jgi:DNA-binding GntR family transcriptional regulator